MKKFVVLVVLCVTSLAAMADEGMWFLMHLKRLNEADMQKKGLKLTAEEIYSINNSSLKDAIVQFNGGCTAEIVSKTGLVFTNHHCGYGAIAELSTKENDYLTNGFWAKNNAEELKPKSLFVRFFVRMDDVSKRILGLVNDFEDGKWRYEKFQNYIWEYDLPSEIYYNIYINLFPIDISVTGEFKETSFLELGLIFLLEMHS